MVIFTTVCFLLTVASAFAFQGVNPGLPGLPLATYGAIVDIPNNQASSMCVDCHTRIPRANVAPGAEATHYVSASLNSDTNSGGGWSAAGALSNNFAKDGTRNNSAYFRLRQWTPGGSGGSGGFSKYASGTASYVYAGDPALTPDTTFALGDETLPNTQHYFTSTPILAAAETSFDSMDLICESCHNVINNVIGGNNMLAAPSSAAGWGYDAAEATMCVFCHGFMYDDQGAQGSVVGTIAPAAGFPAIQDGNYDAAGSGRNFVQRSGVLARRDVNHWHSIGDNDYDQDHHAGTGDFINADHAAAALLWTDNLVIAYSDNPLVTTSYQGTFPPGNWTVAESPVARPAPGLWTDGKTRTAGANFSCMSCHTAGHGGDPSEGASLIRDTDAQGVGTAIDRIQERGWKTFNDPNYCRDCHQERQLF